MSQGAGEPGIFFSDSPTHRFSDSSIPDSYSLAAAHRRTGFGVALDETARCVAQARLDGVVMRFHPKIAPIKAAVFPLVKKEGMPDIAHAIEKGLRKHFKVFYDEKGSIGKRYRRMDEAGTPYCITVDGETLEDGTVTVRDRDTLEQVRIPQDNVVAFIQDKIREWQPGG